MLSGGTGAAWLASASGLARRSRRKLSAIHAHLFRGIDDALNLPDTYNHLTLFLSKLVEDPSALLDYDSLWCIPLFEQPDRVRNDSLADAQPVQEQLMHEGVTQRLPGGNATSTG